MAGAEQLAGGYETLIPDDLDTKDKETEDSGVRFWRGPYVAVVAAAFGQVKAKNSKTSKVQSRMLHPILVLLIACPLFACQLTMIFALRLDLDVSKGLVDEDEIGSHFVLRLKYVMIAMLQLTNFSVMLANTRMLVFVTNPLTWIECERPKPKEWFVAMGGSPDNAWHQLHKIMFHPLLSAIPCTIALLMRFLVSYLVCVDSMSIIFEADSVKEAIFNALVLTFINELNPLYWHFVSELMHIEDDMEAAQIYVTPVAKGKHVQPYCSRTSEGRRTELQESVKQLGLRTGRVTFFPGFMVWIMEWFPFLSRGSGARRWENILSFMLLFMVYVQQLFVAVFARMTNVLPVARDLCTMYRWKHHQSRFIGSLAEGTMNFLQSILLIPLDLAEHLKAINPEEQCVGKGSYVRMLNSDKKRIMFDGDYTFLQTTLKAATGVHHHHQYDTKPIFHTDNDWTGNCFMAGAVCILVLMIFPQISTILDIFRAAFAHKEETEKWEDLGDKLEPGSPSGSLPLQRVAPNKSAPGFPRKYSNRAECMTRVEELSKELAVIRGMLEKDRFEGQ